MPELSTANEVIASICDVLTDHKTIAVGEIMAAAAIVATMADLSDDQALAALQAALKVIREADSRAVN
ncbi:hypothetical protein RLPCCGM1_c1293 [Rhizobium leguminosarum bv. phaseoli CCGM1]|uniref:hypothetical protein n=1 Tax=Rhizobium phaseoli TaxID=396 RepID=UPI0004D8B46E|nr:hypothetical protein [Rhizobium phaseoli]KEC73177.1 hypothetical protein RLPCCGM1_c1293 [Rhizobium leguminosarum bv. phaseoli CCGM1]PWI54146.1 hypothetical protein B5K03_11940 [Rhizobium phaseoli]